MQVVQSAAQNVGPWLRTRQGQLVAGGVAFFLVVLFFLSIDRWPCFLPCARAGGRFTRRDR